MAARTLPDVSFTTGIAIDRMMPRVASVQGLSPNRSWLLIGLIDHEETGMFRPLVNRLRRRVFRGNLHA